MTDKIVLVSNPLLCVIKIKIKWYINSCERADSEWNTVCEYRVFQKCLNRTAKITLAACRLLLLWESCQSGGATHSAVQALMKHSV